MGGHTRTILLVEDGSEAVRQPHADSEAFFRDVLQGSYLKQRELELKVAIDDDCLHELSGVTPGEFACIVFASNALIRSDGPIARAFQNCQEDIERYIGSGGCVVILHQSFPGEVWEPSFLKFLGPVRVNSRSDPSTPLAAQWRGTPLVAQFPNQVTAANLREQPGSACWRASFPLFYSHLVLADDVDLTPLLWTESDHRVLMAEMRSGGRLIMCTAPIDWARQANLTENILAYLLDGLPEVVVTGCSNVLPATTSLAMARLRSQTSVFDLRDSQPAGAAEQEAFLIGNARLVLQICEAPAVATSSPPPVVCEPADGLVVRWTPTSDPRVKVEITVPNRIPGDLTSRLREDIRYLVLEGWASHALIHDIRDVLLANRTLDDTAGAALPQEIRQAGNEHVVARCRQWAADNRAVTDVGTALVVAWVLELVGKPREARELIEDIPLQSDLSPDQQLLRGSLAGATGGRWSREAPQVAGLGSLTPSGAVRMLDAFRQGAAIDPKLSPTQALVAQLALTIRSAPWSTTSGWVSVDRTATIVAGLASMVTPMDRVPDDVVEVLADGAMVLSKWLRTEDSRDQGQVLTRIRVREALLRLEAAIPSGVQQVLSRLVGNATNPGPSLEPAPYTEQLARTLAETRRSLSEALNQEEILTRDREVASNLAIADLELQSRVRVILWSIAVTSALGIASYLVIRTLTAFVDRAPLADQAGAVAALAVAFAFVGWCWTAGGRLFGLRRRLPSDYASRDKVKGKQSHG